MVYLNYPLNRSTPSPLPGACLPATAGTHAELLVYIYFYPRTLNALPHDRFPTMEPGTRSRISSRFMAPRHETPRARRGGTSQAGGRSQRPSGDMCAEPLRLEGSPKTRCVPSSEAGRSQKGTCSDSGIGRTSRAGIIAVNIFGSGVPESVQHQSVCTE